MSHAILKISNIKSARQNSQFSPLWIKMSPSAKTETTAMTTKSWRCQKQSEMAIISMCARERTIDGSRAFLSSVQNSGAQ